jgi:DNA-binding beta-propeller fold protein YncE
MNRYLTVLATVAAFSASVVGPSGYRETNKVAIAGPTGWDYVTVDSANRRVYVSHATQVEVLDADTLKVIGTIPGTPGVHGIAIAPEIGKGFITAGKADVVVMFDLVSLKNLGQVSTGKKPDAIAYDPATRRIFAMNGSSDSTTAINAAEGTVSGAVDLGGGPESTVADGKGNLWVNLEDKSQLVHLDSKSLTLKDRWAVAPCEEPSSLSFDAANRRLFLGCRNRVMAVVDADSGKVVASYPIGDHVDASAFDSATGLVFCSTGDGHIAIFHQDSPDKYTLVENLATFPGSKTMGYDPKTHRIFLPANNSGTFTVFTFDK